MLLHYIFYPFQGWYKVFNVLGLLCTLLGTRLNPLAARPPLISHLASIFFAVILNALSYWKRWNTKLCKVHFAIQEIVFLDISLVLQEIHIVGSCSQGRVRSLNTLHDLHLNAYFCPWYLTAWASGGRCCPEVHTSPFLFSARILTWCVC